MTGRSGDANSLAREVVGLAGLVANLLLALAAGVAVTLDLVFRIPEAAMRMGLIADVTTGVVFVSVALGVAVAVGVMLAVLYIGATLFETVEVVLAERL